MQPNWEQLDFGIPNQTQLNLRLNNFPIEISLIEKKSIVYYFNKYPKMIYNRSFGAQMKSKYLSAVKVVQSVTKSISNNKREFFGEKTIGDENDA